MVEGTGLENRRAVKRTEGSNLSPSAREDSRGWRAGVILVWRAYVYLGKYTRQKTKLVLILRPVFHKTDTKQENKMNIAQQLITIATMLVSVHTAIGVLLHDTSMDKAFTAS